jgi:hypothetical protein
MRQIRFLAMCCPPFWTDVQFCVYSAALGDADFSWAGGLTRPRLSTPADTDMTAAMTATSTNAPESELSAPMSPIVPGAMNSAV